MQHAKGRVRMFPFLRCGSFGAALFLSLPALSGRAQTQAPVGQMAKDATPQFEVAVIKPTDPADRSQGFKTRGRHLRVENESLMDILTFAYAVHPSQIVDAPAWVAHEHFDIDGVPDVEGYPNLKQYQMMVQKLLTSRFHLQFKRDQRELSVYAMTVAKGGPKMAKSSGDPDGLDDQTGYGKGNEQVIKFTNNSMSDLALAMQDLVEKPVVDHTGLPGRYDFSLTWTPDIGVPSEANAAPGIFTAFQEELGLKLQLTKEAADVMVIQRVERPSEN